MKKNVLPVIGILVFIVSVFFIAGAPSSFHFFPSQEVELSKNLLWGPVFKENLLVQEITLKKRYLNRIDVCFAKMNAGTTNDNIFLLLTEDRRILFTGKFTSDEIDGAVFYPFKFNKSLDIGKNKKVLACIYSVNGNPNNFLAYARTTKSALGKFYVTPVQNDDVIASLTNKQAAIPVDGSMGFKVYESGTRFFTFAQVILYLAALAVCLVIVFAGKLKKIILKSNINAEKTYIPAALTFGLLFVFITPPFQVPDEPSHLYRAYQLSELNLFKYQDSVPASLIKIAAISERMKFNVAEKTSRKELLSLSGIRLDPAVRTWSESPNYIMPYVPQALGISFGRLFHLNPLSFFYLARIFNLLVSVLLLYLVIRVTPVYKWLFFVLGMMPMTVYLMASLSYDASTICLSFLFMAFVFKLAFEETSTASRSMVLALFLIAILLASSKPPYFIVIFSFLIIPVHKFGNRKKYLTVFTGILVTTLAVSQLWTPGRKFFHSFATMKPPSSMSWASINPLSFVFEQQKETDKPVPPKELQKSNPVEQKNAKPQPINQDRQNQARETETGQRTPAKDLYSQFNPPAQKKFILENPARYLGIMMDTIGKFAGLYAIAFIGLFGWVDTPLPGFLVYTFFFLLLLVALSDASPGIRINFRKKFLMLTIFLAGFILIETAMYIYCNPVGFKQIQAVQGRYFIALSPLLFAFLYNNRVNRFLDKMLVLSPEKTIKKKPAGKGKSGNQKTLALQLYPKLLPWIIIGVGLTTLFYSLYKILFRFYIILI